MDSDDIHQKAIDVLPSIALKTKTNIGTLTRLLNATNVQDFKDLFDRVIYSSINLLRNKRLRKIPV